MKKVEYKPFTRAELEVINFGYKEYLAFCAVATEQFGKTVSERLAGYNRACMNAEIFALNQRYPQTFKEADKTRQEMMRQVLLGWYDEKSDGFDCPPLTPAGSLLESLPEFDFAESSVLLHPWR